MLPEEDVQKELKEVRRKLHLWKNKNRIQRRDKNRISRVISELYREQKRLEDILDNLRREP